MTHLKPQTDVVLDLVRLSFPVAEEERIAVALAEFLGTRAGNRITELRPELPMKEVLDLGRADEWTTAECSRLLQLAGIEAFDEQLRHMTFREFVRYAAHR